MKESSEKAEIYLKSAGSGLFAKAVQYLTGFVGVWLLNQILTKGGYGNYEFTLALVGMLLILGSGGLQNVAMYRLSRLDDPPEKLTGHRLAGTLVGLSIGIGVLVAGLISVAGPYIAVASDKPELAYWIGLLAFLIPIRVARGVYRNWYQARQLVAESMLFSRILPSTAKVLLLAGAWMFWSTPGGVIGAILLSEIIPLSAWYFRSPTNIIPKVGLLSWWDVKYASKLMITRGISKTNKRADILMMGVLSTSVSTANYVIASKLAMLTLIGHQLTSLILPARMGRFIENSERKKLQTEYHKTRLISLLFSIFVSGVFLVIGNIVLTIFGNYGSAMPVLVVLTTTYLVHVSFGKCGEYLNIAGYAGWTLLVTFVVVFVNIIINAFLIPRLGGLGAAIAMFVSIILSNSLAAYLVGYLDGVNVYSWKVFIITCACVVVSFASLSGGISYAFSSAALFVILGITAVAKLRLLMKIMSYIKNRIMVTV